MDNTEFATDDDFADVKARLTRLEGVMYLAMHQRGEKVIGAYIDGFYCATYIRAVGDAHRITTVLQKVFSGLTYRRLFKRFKLAEWLATFR